MSAPIQLTIDVHAPDLDHIPTRFEDKFVDGQVRNAATWVQSVWLAAVSGGVELPGMDGPVDSPEYAQSLAKPSAITKTGQWSYTVTADYDEASRIEHGFGSYDMKPALLHGPHAKIGKEGQRYNVVPFRFGTPITRGPNKGQSRPHFPGEMTMPQDVYNVVKGGDPYPESGYGQRTKIPLLFTETELQGVNAQAIIRNQPAPMVAPYTWQTGLYSGLKRYGAQGHRQYFTFRAVSEPRRTVRRWRGKNGQWLIKVVEKGSSPDSWIHPGVGANPVIQAVRSYVQPFVERMLLRAVDQIR